MYKFLQGSQVAVKKINRTKVELTRPLLLELKRVNKIKHILSFVSLKCTFNVFQKKLIYCIVNLFYFSS